MAGDGSCLFRSVANDLWGSPRFHGSVRRRAVTWMRCARARGRVPPWLWGALRCNACAAHARRRRAPDHERPAQAGAQGAC